MTIETALLDLRTYFSDPSGVIVVSWDGRKYHLRWCRSIPRVAEHGQVNGYGDTLEAAVEAVKVTAWTLRHQDLFTW